MNLDTFIAVYVGFHKLVGPNSSKLPEIGTVRGYFGKPFCHSPLHTSKMKDSIGGISCARRQAEQPRKPLSLKS